MEFIEKSILDEILRYQVIDKSLPRIEDNKLIIAFNNGFSSEYFYSKNINYAINKNVVHFLYNISYFDEGIGF